jgi:diaminopimelate epimerase
MNLFEAQEFFKSMYPNKKINFEFDEKCHRLHEVVYTEGNPHVVHHVENNKVKVSVEGMDSMYVPIAPHRENVGFAQIKSIINSKQDVFIHDQQLKNINDLDKENKSNFIQELSTLTGLSTDAIYTKIDSYKNS